MARGLIYGVVGALAMALAFGAGTGHAAPNQQGALALIARAPLGKAAMLAIAAALLAYAVWKLSQGILGIGPEGGGGSNFRPRAANLGAGIVYLGFFAVAAGVLGGSGSSGSSAPRHAAAGVLAWPGGPGLVAVAAAVLIAASVYQVYDALSGDFTAEIKTECMGGAQRGVFVVLGRVGLIARAAVFALVGYFLVRTAIEYKASKAVGVDGALARIHRQPFGEWLLALVAVGLITFALFSFMEARFRRL